MQAGTQNLKTPQLYSPVSSVCGMLGTHDDSVDSSVQILRCLVFIILADI